MVISDIEDGELRNADMKMLDAKDVVKMKTADATLMSVVNARRQKELDGIVREMVGIEDAAKKRKREEEEKAFKRLKKTGDFMSLDGFDEPVVETREAGKSTAPLVGQDTKELFETIKTHSITLIHSVDGYSNA